MTLSIFSTSTWILAGAQLHLVAGAGHQRLLAEPEDPAAEDVGEHRRVGREAGDLAALDEDLLVQGDADGLAGANRHHLVLDVPGLDRATCAVLLDGENSKVSPLRRWPLSMRPAMMRRSSNL